MCRVVKAGGCVVTVVVSEGGCIAWCVIGLVGVGDRAGLQEPVWCTMELWHETSCGFVLCNVGFLRVNLCVHMWCSMLVCNCGGVCRSVG